MYLITVARAVEDGQGPPVSVSEIAERLDVSSVSANQMIKKLESLGLVTYVPYRGAALTEEGEQLANVVLRSRRLWGVFFVDHLGLSATNADEVACEMEHVTTAEVAERLSSFLGDPTIGPQGKAIPAATSGRPPTIRLSDVTVGSSAVIESAPPATGAFLASLGIEPGTKVKVSASGGEGSLLVDGPSGVVHLGSDVADDIAVTV